MPLLDLQRRLTEVGRIRLGERRLTARGQRIPAKLDRFRLTSADRARLEAAAAIYGGTVVAWDEGWQVVTESDELDIAVLPGQALSQWWELWGKPPRGRRIVCLRRCDGVREHLHDTPCQCPAEYDDRREQALAGTACRPTTRLSVLLRRVPGIGLWRLETHGLYAAVELAGTAALLEQLTAQRNAPVPARLRLDRRSVPSADGTATHTFVVPVIDVDVTLEQLAVPAPAPAPAVELLEPHDVPAAGTLDTRPTVTDALTAARRPAKVRARTAPPIGPPAIEPSVEPLDAAETDDIDKSPPERPRASHPAADTRPAPPAGRVSPPVQAGPDLGSDGDHTGEHPGPARTPRSVTPAQRLAIACREAGVSDDERRRLVYAYTDGRTSSVRELDPSEHDRFLATVARVQAGELILAERDGHWRLLDPRYGFAPAAPRTKAEWVELARARGLTQAQLMRRAYEIGREHDTPISTLDRIPAGPIADALTAWIDSHPVVESEE